MMTEAQSILMLLDNDKLKLLFLESYILNKKQT